MLSLPSFALLTDTFAQFVQADNGLYEPEFLRDSKLYTRMSALQPKTFFNNVSSLVFAKKPVAMPGKRDDDENYRT